MPAYPIVSLASLLIQETKEAIYATAIRVAEVIGVPVSTWQAGDPTRSLYHVEAETLSALEEIVVGYIKSNFLDDATGDWLVIGAKQRFNVDVPGATYATTDVVLTNTGGGFYPDIAAGDLTFKSVDGKTYRNITDGTLAAGPHNPPTTLAQLTLTVTADEPGSDSSAGAGEIDEMVTTLLGVTCTNPLAAVGLDEQDEAITRQQCLDKLDTITLLKGERGAYRYVARNATLTGTDAVTRARVYGSSDYGDVTVYLAGPSGGVSEPDRALVEDAIITYAMGVCETPDVLAATNVTVNVTYEIWVYKSANKTAAQVEEDVEVALEQMIATREIGGDIIAPPSATGYLYKSLIESTIRSVYPATQAFRVSVSSPAGDTALTNGQVATLGTVTPTVHIVVDA